MKTKLETQSILVIDDFLTQEEHKAMWVYLNSIKYEYVHTQKWTPAFHMSEPAPLWGDPIISHAYEQNTICPVYPTNTSIDIFAKKIFDNLDIFERLIGQQGKDWAYFFLRPYVYPREAGLRWHTDGKYKAQGALVYYAHPYWSPYWGGELLIDDTLPLDQDIPAYGDIYPATRSSFSSSQHDRIIMTEGMGRYILPLPNRLVILKGGPYHTIKKVDESAGDNIRVTVQGFFQDPIKK